MARTKSPDVWVEIVHPCQCSLDGGATVTQLPVGKVIQLAAHLAEHFIEQGKAEECEAPAPATDSVEAAADSGRLALLAEIKEKFGVEMDVDSPYAILEAKKEELQDEADKAEKAAIIEEAKEKYGVGLSSRKLLETLRKDIAELREKHAGKDEE